MWNQLTKQEKFMFNITENVNSEIGSCDYCGAVGGVFGTFTDSQETETDVEMCPECYILIMDED